MCIIRHGPPLAFLRCMGIPAVELKTFFACGNHDDGFHKCHTSCAASAELSPAVRMSPSSAPLQALCPLTLLDLLFCCRGGMGLAATAGWLAWAALAGLVAQRLLLDASLPRHCDTTYIWEGYEEVPMGGRSRYRLIKYSDRDTSKGSQGRLQRMEEKACRGAWEPPSTPPLLLGQAPPPLPPSPTRHVRLPAPRTSPSAAVRALRQPHIVPVLFVHGHLGSHQQMRSAAAETGRELARRLAANASWPLLLQWYAPDFLAEPSALDAALPVRETTLDGCWSCVIGSGSTSRL